MSLPIYRCGVDGCLLTKDSISQGKCLGHTIKYAYEVSFWEYLKIKWWILTGQI